MTMCYEPKESIREKIWTPCPDFRKFTIKEKLLIILENPILLIGIVVLMVSGKNPIFPNCIHVVNCKNIRYDFFGNCKAGEWK